LSYTDESVLRMDLHTHSRGSWDCLSDPGELLAAAESRGIQRVAITDHNRMDVARAMYERFPEKVIPGEEVKTREGIDLIGLYIRREIPKGTEAEEVCRLVREEGGILYLPHPFASGKGGGGRYAETLAPLVDVVEVFNARLHPGRLNEPAEDLARRHGKLRGAGSDAHTLGEVGKAWVEVPPHANRPQDFLAAMKESRVRGRTSSWWVHLASTYAKVHKTFTRSG
jgi:predicted metal-dependent phosphoesterase TrpH